jgi:hypothetical protein
METIKNILFNLDESQNMENDKMDNKNRTSNATVERNNSTFLESNSLMQGSKFKNYQNKKIMKQEVNNTPLIEGFTATELTTKSNNVINETQINKQDEQILQNLKSEYQKTLEQYNSILKSIENDSKIFIDRTNPNNPYLNKTIKFTTGHICYVTNQGVVKYIPSQEIWDSVNAPKDVINVNLPWLNEYNKKGVNIPTQPPLITGTPVKKGQSLGNEGKNIRANSIIQNKNATNMGCFIDDFENPTLTYIGDKPPRAPQDIMNGVFTTPELRPNSFRYINSTEEVVGWNFNATLINNSRAWGYPIPYPSGNQAVSLQNQGSMSQKLFLVKGEYVLSFRSIGRRTQNGPNKIVVYLSDKEIFTQTPPSDRWRGYSVKINIDKDGEYEIKFVGQNTRGDRSTAIQDVRLTFNKTTSGSFTLQQCKDSAIHLFYKFFGLQDYNSKTGKGYCAVTNEEPVYNCDSKKNDIIYNLNSVGVKDNLGDIAFLDSNGDIFPYSNLKLTNVYSKMNGLDNPGNDLKNIQNTNLQNCQTECNKDANCHGFTFDNKKSVCNLKNSSIYPKSSSKVDFDYDLYLREKSPSSIPSGISNVIANTSTNIYENYNDGKGEMKDMYGLKTINSVKMQELNQIRSKLDMLSRDIVAYANKFGNNKDKLLLQSRDNIKGLNNFERDIKNVGKHILNFDLNHENILNESEILLLKENYNYMFWSILAIGSVLVAMNIK